MTERSEEHIADNDDLIERYVLGRLSPDERSAADKHLESCAACRTAVLSEREIAAGIKESGHRELRARLQKRLAASARGQVPWRLIISAAAVVAVVALVGITNNWFHIRNQQPAVPKDTGQEIAQSSPQAAPPDLSRQTPPAPKAQNEIRVEAKPEHSVRKDEAVAKEIDQKAFALRDAPAPVMKSEENRTDKLDAVAEAGNQEMWVEGFVVDRETNEGRVAPGEMKAKKLGTMDAIEGRGARLMLSGGALSSAITLSQEPFRALPSTQQQMQQQQRLRSIATRMKQTSHGLHLTLYPESPIDSSALAQATIESMTDDSLVVVLPGRRIAYRLPSGWRTTRK